MNKKQNEDEELEEEQEKILAGVNHPCELGEI